METKSGTLKIMIRLLDMINMSFSIDFEKAMSVKT
jgi:hypothetical protein